MNRINSRGCLLALAALVCLAGRAGAQPALEIGSGLNFAAAIGDDSFVYVKGLDIRVSRDLSPRFRVDGMFAGGGHGDPRVRDRLFGGQLVTTTSRYRETSMFWSVGLLGVFRHGHGAGSTPTPVIAQGGGMRHQLTRRFSMQNELQWLFPLFGLRATVTAGVRIGRYPSTH